MMFFSLFSILVFMAGLHIDHISQQKLKQDTQKHLVLQQAGDQCALTPLFLKEKCCLSLCHV